jgi:hypothetical protein
MEKESEGEGENLLALNSLVNNNKEPLLNSDQGDVSVNVLEGFKENSNESFNAINKDNLNLNFEGGGKMTKGGATSVDNLEEVIGLDSGQEGGVGGPNPPNNSSQIVTGGVSRKKIVSDVVGLSPKPISNLVGGEGKGELKKGGVYTNGPRGVYELLNNNSLSVANTPRSHRTKKKKGKASTIPCPPSASLRRQHLIAKSLSNRNSHSHVNVASATSESIHPVEEGAELNSTVEVVFERGPMQQLRESSSSQSGANRSCSSINSSCIRNCNKIILKKFEQEVVSKVWHGAVELGVDCSSLDDKGVKLKEVCLKEILDNELRDEEESIRREHKKAIHQ